MGEGGVEHDVVGDGCSRASKPLGRIGHTFPETGSYPYTCTLHIGMNGRVEVVDG